MHQTSSDCGLLVLVTDSSPAYWPAALALSCVDWEVVLSGLIASLAVVLCQCQLLILAQLHLTL